VQGVDPLGLEKSCSQKILEAAVQMNNDSKYSFESDYRFGEGKNKCNLFTHEVIEKAGLDAPRRYKWGLIPRGPITAETWANKSTDVPGFKVVTNPQPGDIVAIEYRYKVATGHVAVVSDISEGKSASIGAGGKGSHTTGWPWNGAPPQGEAVYRRCID